MTNYQVGDFLIRIKNAALAKEQTVPCVLTKQNYAVAKTLQKAGYLNEVVKKENQLTIKLAFSHKAPVLTDLKIVSRPGQRIYLSVADLRKKKGPSIYILNTPKGVLASSSAIKEGTGGEVIAEIW